VAETYRVFWQPGCSSCLKAKEFLTSHHIEYDSVNVLADDADMAALEALGASSVPVVSKGEQFVFAQSLSDLAKFIGVRRPGVILPVNELVARIDRVMAVAQSHVCQLPQESLETSLPGRDRTYPEAFLISARGGTLTFDLFERRPPEEIKSGEDVARHGDAIRQDFQSWWATTQDGLKLPAVLSTYYGDQSISDLMERTAWHAAQHTRQLTAVVETLDIKTADALSESDLSGLPLPDHVYDDQVSLATKAI
jgi:glutaredoxin